ncbi:unnamed protein product [Rotaria socialis]|uniref:Chloride channel protein n=1 Tax=Rotaria socialis TaxID=392032 RepID=A0A817X1Q5_9BILA|nr:unnamed protein product [Rotaria socialis]CAF3299460.1 unnamed protein product [Rotaria socialis]CAF3362577.1 unnamed protein product [Rotaria socialis]CAF3430970.1 unnamed protein product [Rotaria socialis]CAF4388246.1 unnamed protein product [Rotaria socialis]
MAFSTGGSSSSGNANERKLQRDIPTDSCVRLYLSPVPSVEGDEDEDVDDDHQSQAALSIVEQDDSGEEVELTSVTPGTATTVTIVDTNHGVSNPSKTQYDEEVTDVTYVVRKHYENFETIDWLKDLMRNRIRHRNLRAQRRASWRQRFIFWFDAWSGWICVLLVGLSAGLVAGFVDIGAKWMSHWRTGVCTPAFWLNREQCCWGSREVEFDHVHSELCEHWNTWSQIFDMNELSVSAWFFRYFMFIFWSVIYSGFIVCLVVGSAPYASGSGIPEIKTILSGFIMYGYLGKWTFFIKSIGMIFVTSAGLIVGKEGPFVHISCCCGNLFSKLFPKYGNNEARKREILSAAAATGVSVAFGAPIGGILFGLEEISYYFPYKTLWRTFFCCMIGALVVRTINPYGNGHEIQFPVEYNVPWATFEVVPFICLGILGGLWGTLFIKTNIRWLKYKKTSRIGQYPRAEVVILTLITAFICYPNLYLRLTMPELIRRLVGQCRVDNHMDLCDYEREKPTGTATSKLYSALAGPGIHRAIWQLFWALIVQITLVIFTIGTKIPSGLIVPSISIGAIAGRLIGIITEQIAYQNQHLAILRHECGVSNEHCVTPGLYAVVGACAFLGGVSRMTVSLVVIMSEVTGGLSYIVPLMVTALAAKWVGDAFGEGIYEENVKLSGYPYLENRESFRFTLKAGEAVRASRSDETVPLACIIQDGMTIAQIDRLLHRHPHSIYPVIISEDFPCIVGQVQRRDLLAVLKSRKTQSPQIQSKPLLNRKYSVVSMSNLLNKSGQPSSLGMRRASIALQASKILKLHKLVDRAPIIVTDQTPMEAVVDMFRKLGCRQIFVTKNGRLHGILTRKDIIRLMQEANISKKLEH